jgi:hypothetical protein
MTPDRLQGRMNATFRTVYWGAQPLGGFLGGVLGANIGLPTTIVLGGLIAAACCTAVLFTPLRRIRTATVPV